MGDEARTDSLAARLEEPATKDLLFRILDRLDTLTETVTGLKALTDIGSNSLVERVAESADRAVTLLDRASDPAVVAVLDKLREVEGVIPALERIAPLVSSGGLDMLVEVGTAAAAINRLMTDGLLERLVSQVEQASQMLELVKALPIEKMNAAVHKMEEVGALETLPDVAAGVVALSRIVNDQFVERIMVTLEHWVTEVEILYSAVNRISDEGRTGSGIMGMISLLGDAENQKAIYTGLELVKAIRAARH
uniref:DUF1641 domain-containing protein n=1 Tax=Leptospirillum ferrodiazotrophum TaxID=412449 RepID=C6HW06_9BACT|nr:MAG: protein of unknown function [Leptospirillum ferrodiazotrophum]